MTFTQWLSKRIHDRDHIGRLARAMQAEYDDWYAAKKRGKEFRYPNSNVPCLPWRDSFSWLKRHLTLRNEPQYLHSFFVAWKIFRREIEARDRRSKTLSRRRERWNK